MLGRVGGGRKGDRRGTRAVGFRNVSSAFLVLFFFGGALQQGSSLAGEPLD